MWFQVVDQPLFAVASFWQSAEKGNGFAVSPATRTRW